MRPFLLLAIALLPAAVTVPQTPSAGPVSIFDGRTFDGWEGDLKNFRIEQGAIVAGTLERKIPRNEFLCTTKTYSDFELRLQVKLLGGQGANAGVQFRTARIPNHHEVSGYQADVGVGWWGALYDESRRNRILQGPDKQKMAQVVRPDEWNDYTVRADGKRIQLWLNGVQTVDFTEDNPTVAPAGVICVQIHSGPPSEAWYRQITIAGVAKPIKGGGVDEASGRHDGGVRGGGRHAGGANEEAGRGEAGGL